MHVILEDDAKEIFVLVVKRGEDSKRKTKHAKLINEDPMTAKHLLNPNPTVRRKESHEKKVLIPKNRETNKSP